MSHHSYPCLRHTNAITRGIIAQGTWSMCFKGLDLRARKLCLPMLPDLEAVQYLAISHRGVQQPGIDIEFCTVMRPTTRITGSEEEITMQ
ncbi:hypothetical protein DOTSEDRAFT_69767 [Dothistroma septosporum NZE10]|uniref:Uncharacterized protein n=1 Tax=Dothistroma septosporum (strain NZE10 / CBS 128990) TaxID=675120 RepID=N1PY75_DOTSN|nr:hypothetical protein DOTSEDRAFT_69767 [Dothistroma septosporum NZE10]